MKKLHLFALLWSLYFICSAAVAISAILWLPSALFGVAVGGGLGGVLLLMVTAGIDCAND